MDPERDATRRTSRIDTLISRARLADARGRDGAGLMMPAMLLAQLGQPSAGAATPSKWTGPTLTLLLIAALGGMLYALMPRAQGAADPLTLGFLTPCLVSGLTGALTGLLVGQGHTLGLSLAKWLTIVCGAGCTVQLVAAAFDTAGPAVGPLVIGAVAATASWCLMNSESFGGFVTYRILLRQARRARAKAGDGGRSSR